MDMPSNYEHKFDKLLTAFERSKCVCPPDEHALRQRILLEALTEYIIEMSTRVH